MSKNISKKLEQQEIEQLIAIEKTSNILVKEFGEISIIETNLELRKNKAKESLIQLNNFKNDFSVKLEDKYGKGKIDLSKGEFIPQ